jgi:hypothetical protein
MRAFPVALTVALLCVAQPALDDGDKSLENLRRALKATSGVARLYFSDADCSSPYLYGAAFPKLNSQPATTTDSPLAAARSVFAGEPRVTITGRAPGLVDIRLGDIGAGDALLKTGMPRLNLSSFEQWNDLDAITAITGYRTIRDAETRLGLKGTGGLFDHLVQTPDHDAPHMPPTLHGLTMDQALDRVATTFGGIVIFAMCRKEDWRGYVVEFASVRDWDDSP